MKQTFEFDSFELAVIYTALLDLKERGQRSSWLFTLFPQSESDDQLKRDFYNEAFQNLLESIPEGYERIATPEIEEFLPFCLSSETLYQLAKDAEENEREIKELESKS